MDETSLKAVKGGVPFFGQAQGQSEPGGPFREGAGFKGGVRVVDGDCERLMLVAQGHIPNTTGAGRKRSMGGQKAQLLDWGEQGRAVLGRTAASHGTI